MDDAELTLVSHRFHKLASHVPEGAKLYLTDKGSQYILDNMEFLSSKKRGSKQSRVQTLIDIGNTGDSIMFHGVFGKFHLGAYLDKGYIDYEGHIDEF